MPTRSARLRLTGSGSAVELLESRRLFAAVLAFDSDHYDVGEGAGTLTVTVRRLESLAGPVEVSFQTTDVPLPLTPIDDFLSFAEATPGQDYTHSFGTLAFADGQAAATFTVPIL